MKTLLTFTILLVSTSVFTQKKSKDIPDFGKIETADLQMKECSIDKDAEAYKLLDLGEVNYERGKNFFRMRTYHRIRIKILKDKGIDQANIKILFYSKENYETIKDITGITYNLLADGSTEITKLEKASVFTKKVDNIFSQVAFTMPNLKVGSVIEYQYTDLKESIEHLKDWYFQDDIPTRISKYKITVPSIFNFVSQKLTYQQIEEKSDEISDQMSTAEGVYRYTSVEKIYTLRDVPALRKEPFMGAPKDYLQRIQFHLSSIDYGNGHVEQMGSTWKKLTEQLLENPDFGLQMKRNIPKTQELNTLLIGASSDYTKMTIIHDYVRRNMNQSDNSGIYTMDGVRSAWDKKYGTGTEINMILIDLLKNSGLTSYPLLVSTRDHGTVNTFYPFLQQFDEVMAYVKIGDKNYVLNGADKYNPSRLTPYDVMNTQGFVVDQTNGGWIQMDNNTQRYNTVVNIMADINKEGIMDGDAVINSADYAKNPRVKKWKENKSKFTDYFISSGSTMKIDSFSIANADNDTLGLEQTVHFKNQLSSSGDYKYFTLNMFTGLEKNPFIADERHTDIDFGYTQYYAVYGSITLPEGFKVEELPKNIKMITPDTSIIMKRILQLDGSTLQMKLTLDFTKPIYYAADYPAFKEFYKKLFSILNEQIVIKKATP